MRQRRDVVNSAVLLLMIAAAYIYFQRLTHEAYTYSGR
jgi:hypothetical protein